MFGIDEIKKKQMILREGMNCSTENHPKMNRLVQFLREHPKEGVLDIAEIKRNKYPLKSTIRYVLSVLFFTLAVFFALLALSSYGIGIASSFLPIAPGFNYVFGLLGFMVGLTCTGTFLFLGFLMRHLGIKHDETVNACLSKKIENLMENDVVQSMHLPEVCARNNVLLDKIVPMALDKEVAITVDSSKKHKALEVVNTIQKTESSLYHIWSHLLKIDTENQDIFFSIFSKAMDLFFVSENEGPSPLHLLQKKFITPMPRTIRFFDKEYLEAPIERPQMELPTL